MPPNPGQFNALITTLHEEGGRKKDDILRHAREEASRIVNDAHVRMEQANSRSLEMFRQQMDDRAARRLNSARREARRLVEEARAQVIRQTVDAVLRHLEEVRQATGYKETVESLLSEVLPEFDGETVVMADGPETALLRAIADSHGYGNIGFEEVPGMGGGLDAKSADGRIIVRNTFASRVVKARDQLIEEMGRRMKLCNV